MMWPWSSKKTNAKKLLKAIKLGDIITVQTLLKERTVDVNVRDQEGKTPLHWAVVEGYVQVLELLLNANADPNAKDEHGWTPLHSASIPRIERSTKWRFSERSSHMHVVEILLKANADTNAKSKDGETPLHSACSYKRTEVARILLKSHSDIHSKDHEDYEPLHKCIMSKDNALLTKETLQTLRVLASFGATWDVKCDELVEFGKARKEAPALRLCMQLWAQEHKEVLPLSAIPLEVVQRGVDNTQTYIDSLKTGGVVVFRQKICMVGCSCAGKTSFVKSIIFGQPQLVHIDDRTIGIDHHPLRFVRRVVSRDQDKVYEITFWDFAGQDAYQVAHSLFFSPRTLFFVFIDIDAFFIAYMQSVISADQEMQETLLMNEFIERTVVRWTRMILSRQPDAHFEFIVTKVDALEGNDVVERLLKDALMVKLVQVEAEIREMKRILAAKELAEDKDGASRVVDKALAFRPPAEDIDANTRATERNVLYVSNGSPTSIRAARIRVEEIIVKSDRSFQMPENYSQTLKAIVTMKETAAKEKIHTRLLSVFVPFDKLPQLLGLEPTVCRAILQTLHDLGDVLWYENLGVDLFQNTVILDPLLLIDFIRQVINHKHTGQTLPHTDLKSKAYWSALQDLNQMKAMKQVLQEFHLVYSADENHVMEWDSDLIVPAYWQTKTPASWLFLGDILRINETRSCENEAVRVHWEFHYEHGLPFTLFDHVIVASISPYITFDAGPDWIMYKEDEIAGCRLMVGRDPKSLHRTIEVEAVVATSASEEQAQTLWEIFEWFCGSFFKVQAEYSGLIVSSFVWDVDTQRDRSQTIGGSVNVGELVVDASNRDVGHNEAQDRQQKEHNEMNQ